MKAIVTGVAGFIGSHLAEQLIAKGNEVIGLDCFTDFYPKWMKMNNLRSLASEEGFSFVEGDIVTCDLEPLLDEVEVVFHLAAQAGVRESWGENFQVYTHHNVLATQRLLELVKEMTLRKFVYASSSSIYGDVDSFPMREADTPQPVSPYGVSKLAAEHLCYLYWRNYGVPTVSLRYFTVYGPRQRPDMAFHRFIRSLLVDEEVVVYGDGDQTRDFTFVADIVQATIRSAESEACGEVFNVGGGTKISLKGAIDILSEVSERKTKVRHESSQKGDVRHTLADIGKARHVLDYNPAFRLEEGLLREFEWLQSLDLHGNF